VCLVDKTKREALVPFAGALPLLRAPLESGHVPVEAQDAADRDRGAPKRTAAATAKDK